MRMVSIVGSLRHTTNISAFRVDIKRGTKLSMEPSSGFTSPLPPFVHVGV
jgi:hypothetical protein